MGSKGAHRSGFSETLQKAVQNPGTAKAQSPSVLSLNLKRKTAAREHGPREEGSSTSF